MRAFIKAIALAILLVTSGLAASTTAQADTLTFRVQSTYEYTQRIAFYSRTYNREWPGGGKSWVIDDYDVTAYKLNCTRGERICYGAWDDSGELHWGVGRDGKQGCSTCCYTCNGNISTGVIKLTGN